MKRYLVTLFNGQEVEMDLPELRTLEPNDVFQVIDTNIGCNVCLSTLRPIFLS